LAIAIMLLLANATTLVGHWHASLDGCSCDLCRTCNLTAPEPLRPVQIEAPGIIEWHVPAVEVHAVSEPVLVASSPRAPPVFTA